MFFRKKSHPQEENVAKKSIKHVDTVVTGLILGGIVASLYGIKRYQKDDKKEEDINDALPKKIGEKGLLRRFLFGNK